MRMMLTYSPIAVGTTEYEQRIINTSYPPVSGDLKSGMPAEVLTPA